MRKFIASTTIAASLIGGGAAVIVLSPAGAGAQVLQDVDSTEAPGLSGVLQGLVADGTISQDQADSIADAINEARQNGDFGRRGGRGHHQGGRGFGGGGALAELGLDADVVRQGLADGLSLGEIAEANGSSAAAVADALVEQMTARLDTAVENGRIDQATADEKAAEIEERVDDIVSGEAEFGGHRGRGRFGGERPSGFDTPDAGEETAA